MKVEEFFEWLVQHNLKDMAVKYYPYFKEILRKNLAVTNEAIVIIGDLGSENKNIAALVSACYYIAAKDLNLNVELIIQKPKFRGDKASSEMIERFLYLRDRSIILMCTSGKLGSLKPIGRSFRKYAIQKKHRFGSISGLNFLKNRYFPTIVSVMSMDPEKMHKRGIKIKEQLDNASEVRITTDIGTDVTINKKGVSCIINSGYYVKDGTGGNIPAGEVYFHPKGFEGVDGKVIIDGSVRTHEGTFVLRNKVTLFIKKGSIVKIEGGKEAKLLIESIENAKGKAIYKENVWKIAEIGIGINPNARIIGPTIIDEKTLGTAHIANGSNHWFGGEIMSSIHYDHVFREPKIFVDGKRLIM